MFKQTREYKPNGNGGVDRPGTVIGDGAAFSGTLRADGDVLVNGAFDGALQAGDGILVGKSGVVTGDLFASTATIEGRVKGNVTARDRVELRTGSRLEGDVHARSFMIEDGVFFQGNCVMGEPVVAEIPENRTLAEVGILK